jgi:hypothetical protein
MESTVGRAMAQAVSSRPVTADGQVNLLAPEFYI